MGILEFCCRISLPQRLLLESLLILDAWLELSPNSLVPASCDRSTEIDVGDLTLCLLSSPCIDLFSFGNCGCLDSNFAIGGVSCIDTLADSLSSFSTLRDYGTASMTGSEILSEANVMSEESRAWAAFKPPPFAWNFWSFSEEVVKGAVSVPASWEGSLG